MFCFWNSCAVLQPGKLTEAFKYFLQGMGYSKYIWHGCLCLCPLVISSNKSELSCSAASVMSCISWGGTWVVIILPSVSFATFAQSLMWRIGGWVEGQVLPPPCSPLTSYCCPVWWRWHLEIHFNQSWSWIQSFWAVLILLFYFCCHFWWFLLIPRTLNPIFVLSKIFFPPTKKYTALTSSSPFFCHCIPSTALCMAFSWLWAKPFRLILSWIITNITELTTEGLQANSH